MKTLTPEQEEAVHDAVRVALFTAYDVVEDIEVFPDEYTAEEVAEALAKVALLQEVTDALGN